MCKNVEKIIGSLHKYSLFYKHKAGCWAGFEFCSAGGELMHNSQSRFSRLSRISRSFRTSRKN